MTTLIELNDVTVDFRRNRVLSGVNLRVEQGESCAIVGANGSGKTVLLKTICGFITPTGGTVNIDPDYLGARDTFPADFGIILDRPGYLANRSGFDNLRALADIRKIIDDDAIVAAMDAVGLVPDLPRPVGRYSMGMKQRLGLAQAIMENQRVLILDEPFNALDEDGVAAIRSLLLDKLDGGCTLVFTSHNPADIETLAQTRYRIQNQTLMAYETDPNRPR